MLLIQLQDKFIYVIFNPKDYIPIIFSILFEERLRDLSEIN